MGYSQGTIEDLYASYRQNPANCSAADAGLCDCTKDRTGCATPGTAVIRRQRKHSRVPAVLSSTVGYEAGVRGWASCFRRWYTGES